MIAQPQIIVKYKEEYKKRTNLLHYAVIIRTQNAFKVIKRPSIIFHALRPAPRPRCVNYIYVILQRMLNFQAFFQKKSSVFIRFWE